MIDLSKHQQEAFDKILNWWRMGSQADQRFVLAGYAGTGKTSLARVFEDYIGAENVLFLAYTGKAVNVLKDKGIKNASTIHSAIYQLSQKEQMELCKMQRDYAEAQAQGISENALMPLLGKISSLKDKLAQPQFVPSGMLNGDRISAPRLIIVDEYSMLDKEIVEDLERLSIRILYLGDPFQLPPVKEGGCPLEGKENFTLTEIHRQAEGSPILEAATRIRNFEPLEFGDFGAFKYFKSGCHTIDYETYYRVENQIIVGTNRTKHNINTKMRRARGYTGLPTQMEKMICLKNNRDHGLFNGMMDHVAEDSFKEEERSLCYDLCLSDRPDVTHKVWTGDLTGEKYHFLDQKINWMERFDFAYAITCHKSQGSEYDNVLVYRERNSFQTDEEFQRWLYTAVTRGKNNVTLIH